MAKLKTGYAFDPVAVHHAKTATEAATTVTVPRFWSNMLEEAALNKSSYFSGNAVTTAARSQVPSMIPNHAWDHLCRYVDFRAPGLEILYQTFDFEHSLGVMLRPRSFDDNMHDLGVSGVNIARAVRFDQQVFLVSKDYEVVREMEYQVDVMIQELSTQVDLKTGLPFVRLPEGVMVSIINDLLEVIHIGRFDGCACAFSMGSHYASRLIYVQRCPACDILDNVSGMIARLMGRSEIGNIERQFVQNLYEMLPGLRDWLSGGHQFGQVCASSWACTLKNGRKYWSHPVLYQHPS